MKEYEICNLYVEPAGGSIGDYKFKRTEDYNEKIKLFNKPEREIKKFKILFISAKEKVNELSDENEPEVILEPIRYGSHQVTAIATIDEEKEKKSIFSNEHTQIYDILLLYNFLIGQNSCLKADIGKFMHLQKRGVFLDEECKYTISHIINSILEELGRDEWQNGRKDKEILSFLFYLDSMDPKDLQISFIEKHISFSILESADQFNGLIFDTYHLSSLIPLFYKGDFKEIISIIRNKYVHSGQCSLAQFKNELMARTQVTPKLKNFVNSIDKNIFNKFKIDTWKVMDYLLARIFSQVFCIDKKVEEFNTYWFRQIKIYFSKIYN